MGEPWEVKMQFEKKLKQCVPVRKPLNSVAQQFQSSATPDLQRRLKRVKNIVDESYRVVEEGRPPAFNSSALSSCANCSCCESCSKQIATTAPSVALNSTIQSVMKAYEAFLEMQKAQFMAMLQQICQAQVDESFGPESASCTSSSCVVINKTSQEKATLKPAGFSTFHSGNHSKQISAPPFRSQRLQDQVFESPTSTVQKEEDDFNSTSAVDGEDTPDDSQETARSNFKKKEDMDVTGSFNGFIDENFKPLRRSLSNNPRECYVLLEQVDTTSCGLSKISNEKEYRPALSSLDNQVQRSTTKHKKNVETKLLGKGKSLKSSEEELATTLNDEMQRKKGAVQKESSKALSTDEKERFLLDLSLVFNKEAPAEKSNETDSLQPRLTRSGRSVQKPQDSQWWKKGVQSLECVPEAPQGKSRKRSAAPKRSEPKEPRGRKRKYSNATPVNMEDVVSTAPKRTKKQKEGEKSGKLLLDHKSQGDNKATRKNISDCVNSKNKNEPFDQNGRPNAGAKLLKTSARRKEGSPKTRKTRGSEKRSHVEEPAAEMVVDKNITSANKRKEQKGAGRRAQNRGRKKILPETDTQLTNSKRKKRINAVTNLHDNMMDISSPGFAEPDYICYFEDSEDASGIE